MVNREERKREREGKRVRERESKVSCFLGFYGISTFLGYTTPNPNFHANSSNSNYSVYSNSSISANSVYI